ncbi:MAG: TonB-dependent receptor [Ignavibacteria bacterium]
MNKIFKNLALKLVLVIAAFFIIVAIASTLQAQDKTGSITGSVIDKQSGAPIEGADVTVNRVKDSTLVKGTATDASGKFTISDVPFGRYYIKANLVGYNFSMVSGVTINPENLNAVIEPIKLSTGSTTTEEIVVESEKSLIEFKPDKKVFNVSKNLTSQGGMLIDLLKEIPSITVDQDGNVSLRGGEGVKIMIDGRPFGLDGQNRTIILEQTPASDVESVELITNPSAKYEAEGSTGIINIIMKKDIDKGLGYNGALGLNAGTGDKYNGQFSLTLKNNKFSVFGNYGYNSRNNTNSGYSDRTYYNNSSLSRIYENSTGLGRGRSHNVKFGLDYFVDKQNTIGLSLSYRKNERSRNSTGEYQEFDLSNNVSTDYSSSSISSDKGTSLDINGNYMLRFKKPQQVLTADVSYSQDIDDDINNSSNTYFMPQNTQPPLRNEFSKEKNYSFQGQVDYVQPFTKESRLEAGYKGSYNQRDDDYRIENFDYTQNQYITDPGQSNDFLYKQQVHGLYGIYINQLGDFGFSLGGRVEQTFMKGSLTNSGQNFDRNYINFFPSASLSQKLSSTSEIQASYSRRINRPRMGQLNPFRSTSMGSTTNYSEGNPNLNPEFTDSYELSFIKYLKWATITPSVFYRYTKDEISRSRTLLDSVSTLTTFVNYNNSRTYGGELIMNLTPAKFVSFNTTLSYYRSEVDASNLGTGFSNNGDSWSARAMANFMLPADFNVQSSYFYSGKRISAQGTFEPIQMLDLAVKKDFFDKKLSVTARVSDLLNQAKFRFSIFDPDFSEISERFRDSRTFFLGITYNFGQQDKKQNKKKKGNENNEGNDDDGYGF